MTQTNLVQINRDFIIEWNYRFPVDRWWRQKYNIALFSEQHLNVSQVDIALEYYEQVVFKEFENRAVELNRREKDYKKGIWHSQSEPTSQEEIDDLFDKIDVSQMNNNSQLQFE